MATRIKATSPLYGLELWELHRSFLGFFVERDGGLCRTLIETTVRFRSNLVHWSR